MRHGHRRGRAQIDRPFFDDEEAGRRDGPVVDPGPEATQRKRAVAEAFVALEDLDSDAGVDREAERAGAESG